MLQRRHGGGQHEHPPACQQGHGLPQAAEVSTCIPPSQGLSLRHRCLLKEEPPVPQVPGGGGGLQQSHLPGRLLFQGFRPQGHRTGGFRETPGGQTRSALQQHLNGHFDQVWTLVCMVACSRFRGGAEAGTREQAGPERAPESADRTFVHPIICQWDISSDNMGGRNS